MAEPQQQPGGPENVARTVNQDEYFMGVACLSAKMSTDPNTKVGACIVNLENKIIATGFNCMPNGCEGHMPWGRDGDDPLKKKYFYVCHAELNAIMNKNSADVKGCTIYVSLFPCNECTKILIQAGIGEVVYLSDKYAKTPATIASKSMLERAGVPYRQLIPRQEQTVIDFSIFH